MTLAEAASVVPLACASGSCASAQSAFLHLTDTSPLNGPATSSIIGSLVAGRRWVTLAKSDRCDIITNGAVCVQVTGLRT